MANSYSTSSIAKIIPRGAWDSHMHIVDPGRYPLASDAHYTPPVHTLPQAMDFESSIGISNIVLVQPSIYGFDNSYILDALAELDPEQGRGVVVIDPDTIQPDSLEEWHKRGVRGVRLNLKSTGTNASPEELKANIRRHADAIRPWNWVLQLYIPMDSIPTLLDVVPNLGVPVCLDHFGAPSLQPFDNDPSSFKPSNLPGFSALVTLLQQGNTYVKISAGYRLSNDPKFRALGVLARELMGVARNRLVFATDWPHTRFDGIDIKPFTEACLEWCEGDKELENLLFRQNAEELWDVKGKRPSSKQRL